MGNRHSYHIMLDWTGNKGSGTSSYRAYARDYSLIIDGKTDILGSSDPAFLGDPRRHNPEDLFLASVSSCHMLWYLHLASANGITVTDYKDAAEGTMQTNPDGSGEFTQIILRPTVVIDSDQHITLAESLHDQVGDLCFIARSIKVPITHEVTMVAQN